MRRGGIIVGGDTRNLLPPLEFLPHRRLRDFFQGRLGIRDSGAIVDQGVLASRLEGEASEPWRRTQLRRCPPRWQKERGRTGGSKQTIKGKKHGMECIEIEANNCVIEEKFGLMLKM